MNLSCYSFASYYLRKVQIILLGMRPCTAWLKPKPAFLTLCSLLCYRTFSSSWAGGQLPSNIHCLLIFTLVFILCPVSELKYSLSFEILPKLKGPNLTLTPRLAQCRWFLHPKNASEWLKISIVVSFLIYVTSSFFTSYSLDYAIFTPDSFILFIWILKSWCSFVTHSSKTEPGRVMHPWFKELILKIPK